MQRLAEPNDRVIGAWDHPYNLAKDRAGSIHDDAMAKELGFRGAFVSARTHLIVFSPLLLEAFGERWFERGTISMEFRVGTLEQEAVRAVLQARGGESQGFQTRAWLEDAAGNEIAVGTASVGSANEPTSLATKDLTRGDTESPYSLLGDVRPGQAFPDEEVFLKAEQAERYVHATASGLPWYSGPSPWGGPIASQGVMVSALGAPCTAYRAIHPIEGVAIDGAIELRNIGGPVFLNKAYRASGEVIGRGKSPRTEYIWYESRLDDMQGRRVAEMRMQLRFLVARQGLS
jgi:hypothetical protein